MTNYKLSKQLHASIANLYQSGNYTTEHIAKTYNITPRQVQRIAKAQGVIRTQSESNKLIAPLKTYRTIPQHMRVKRKHITRKVRYQVIAAHPWCANCGMRPDDGIRLEVDHKDNNPSNNAIDNLQVLCGACNQGKSHLDRFDA